MAIVEKRASLAVPYAMGELGAYAQSLELYNDAIGIFERERVSLDESIGAIRSGKLPGGGAAGAVGDFDSVVPISSEGVRAATHRVACAEGWIVPRL